MNYRQLNYILKIAEEKNISSAAKKLYISQPSLSQLLSTVEKKIGSPIFDRSSSPLSLTYIGELYIKAARNILGISKQFYKQVDDVLHLREGTISIGCSPFRSTYLLSRFIPYFQKNYPDIKLELCENTTICLEELAQNDKTDVSISLLPIDKNIFSYEKLFEERLLLAVPPKHSICIKHKLIPGDFLNPPLINLSELNYTPFILMERGQKLHHTLLNLCHDANFIPQIKLITQSMETAQALAGAGIGAALLPHTLVQSLQSNPAPCYLKLSSRPTRKAIIIWRKNRYLSKAAQKFIYQLKDFCASSIN